MEIELTGITQEAAAQAVARALGASVDNNRIHDAQGREWRCKYDGSIESERYVRTVNKRRVYEPVDDRSYQVEMVTPPLGYADIGLLQNVVRELRHAKGKVNGSCGLHVHVDGAAHTGISLRNLLSIMFSKEDILFKALRVRPGGVTQYSQKVKEHVVGEARAVRNLTKEQFMSIWRGVDRYHALNLQSMLTHGTVEFRLFNATLHAGEVRTYVTLALAMNAQALRQSSTRAHRTASTNERFTFRTWLLHLGMIGDEFEAVRKHLLKHLSGDAAWRNDRSQYPASSREDR